MQDKKEIKKAVKKVKGETLDRILQYRQQEPARKRQPLHGVPKIADVAAPRRKPATAPKKMALGYEKQSAEYAVDKPKGKPWQVKDKELLPEKRRTPPPIEVSVLQAPASVRPRAFRQETKKKKEIRKLLSKEP